MERKSYFRLGIVLAVFAALVSLMCIAFSYADVNDVNAEDVAADPQTEAVVEPEQEAVEEKVGEVEVNGTFTITLNVTDPDSAATFYYGGESVTSTVTTGECVSYTLAEGKSSKEIIITENSSNGLNDAKPLSVILNGGYTTDG